VVRGDPAAVESSLLGRVHRRRLVADEVVVALTGRGLEEEKRAEAEPEPGHTPRYLDFTASFASSAAGALLCTIWPRESTCTVSATDSASGRFCSTSRSDKPSRYRSGTMRPTRRHTSRQHPTLPCSPTTPA